MDKDDKKIWKMAAKYISFWIAVIVSLVLLRPVAGGHLTVGVAACLCYGGFIMQMLDVLKAFSTKRYGLGLLSIGIMYWLGRIMVLLITQMSISMTTGQPIYSTVDLANSGDTVASVVVTFLAFVAALAVGSVIISFVLDIFYDIKYWCRTKGKSDYYVGKYFIETFNFKGNK